MRKVHISDELSKKVDIFCNDIFKNRTFLKPLKLLNDYKDELSKNKIYFSIKGIPNKKKIDYIDKLIKEYYPILKAKPNEIDNKCKEFDKIIDKNKVEKDEKFYKKILECLRYEDLRDNEYLAFASGLGYKSCFYCNAQLAVIVPISEYKRKSGLFRKGDIKERKATFELDHIKPKSKYPFLATSFYNLIPSCSICNKAKSNKELGFNFFEEDETKLDLISFVLTKDSEQEFWNSKNKEDFKIEYNFVYDKNKYNDIFKIQEIYDTQKDIVEELFYLREVYTPTYKKSLVNDLCERKLFPDEAMIERIILRNYSKPEDIHKRPLAKFTQDIAKSLEIIK